MPRTERTPPSPASGRGQRGLGALSALAAVGEGKDAEQEPLSCTREREKHKPCPPPQRGTDSALSIRFANSDDVPQILAMIRELAEYEKLAHEVVATEEGLRRSLFGERPYAEVLLAESNGVVAGFVLFFHNYSTFLGKPGLYIEDIYIRADYRSLGIGKRLLSRIVQLAKERDCGRIEWWVLDWNKPAITFYEKLGAQAMDGWTVYRLEEKQFEYLTRE